MGCTETGSGATSVQITRLSRTNPNDPKYQLVFDVPVPLDATRFSFTKNGVNYTVILGCADRTVEEELASNDLDSIFFISGNTVRATYETEGLLGIVVGDIITVDGATNEINDGTFEITDVRVGSSVGVLDVDAIDWQSGTTVRNTYNGTPDLSNVEIGDRVANSSATNASNDGDFIITAVNDGSDYIEYTNPARTDATDDEVSDSPATSILSLLGYVEYENSEITDDSYDEFGDSPATATIYDGTVINSQELPVGWSESLPCDEEIVEEITFYDCTQDPCCGGGEPIPIDSGIIDLDSYSPSDIDEGNDPDADYYGFTTIEGDWYILKVLDGSYTYAFPSYNPLYDNYADAWTNRATLTYKEFSEIAN